jgi:hypothetical protein
MPWQQRYCRRCRRVTWWCADASPPDSAGAWSGSRPSCGWPTAAGWIGGNAAHACGGPARTTGAAATQDQPGEQALGDVAGSLPAIGRRCPLVADDPGTSLLGPQSAHDEVSGLDPGLHVRTDHGVHVDAGSAEGVRDVGGEIVLHPRHDAVDRSSHAIHPPEGDHHDDVINLAVQLGNVAVPGKLSEAILYVVHDKAEPVTRENNRISRRSRNAR